MKEYETRQITANIPVKITCDICGKSYDIEIDWMEAQEFHSIALSAGYGSVFGDGNTIECDICQYCLKEKLGQYFRITSWMDVYDERDSNDDES